MANAAISHGELADFEAAEARVTAALSGSGDTALEACLSQMHALSESEARSSVTYQVWSEWLQVNQG